MVTALVRNPTSIEAVKKIGVSQVVTGGHDDLDLIVTLTSEADIVFNCADADDLPLTRAVIEGIKIRNRKNESDGKGKPILIHTSGTGVVADSAEGEFAESGKKIWNVSKQLGLSFVGLNLLLLLFTKL